jgi:hypothetical protein
VREKLWFLRQNIGVDILDAESVLREKIRRLSKKLQARHSPVLGIGIRKPLSDVAQSRSAQQRIDDSMAEHISVGMCDEGLPMGYLHAAENQVRTRPEAMQIEAKSDSKLHDLPCSSCRKNRARIRSSGLVILMFLSEPRTTATGRPRRSTRLDSSVP